jgi:pimeloyl-ACP methyl ester carboxylesterase
LGVKVHYFGGSPNLIGAFHSPQRLRARSASVLLCNPFGEEASRAHRIYRVLATQLERAGYATLRFDFSGTGDSSGEADDATIEQWLRDLATAAAELRGVSGSPRVALVGLRLGATLAALATSRGELRPRHLILWDPVVSGAAYLGELAEQHRQYMKEEMGEAGWQDRLQISPEGYPTEALGTPIAPALMRQLAAIDLTKEQLAADLLTVVATHSHPDLERWRARIGESATTRWVEMQGSAAWNSDAALNAATVPMDIVQAILSRIEETIP